MASRPPLSLASLRQLRWHGKHLFDPELRLHTSTAKVKQDKIPKKPMSTDGRPLLTLGHSNHPSAHFLTLLARHGVEVVADVRSRPYSRFVPQYRKQPRALPFDASMVRSPASYWRRCTMIACSAVWRESSCAFWDLHCWR
jgi:hypothetical protein